MVITLDGKDFQGTSGGIITIDPGTYPMTLKGARIYRDWDFEKTKLQVKLDLIWDSGMVGENDDGDEVDIMVYDSFIVLSLNEKANLVKRLAALLSNDFNPAEAKVNLEIEGYDDLEALPTREESRANVNRFEINGESIFGKQALVEVGLNKNGYNKVTNVSRPMSTPAGGKVRAKPAGAPA